MKFKLENLTFSIYTYGYADNHSVVIQMRCWTQDILRNRNFAEYSYNELQHFLKDSFVEEVVILQRIFFSLPECKLRCGGAGGCQRSLCSKDVVHSTASSLTIKILYSMCLDITFIDKCQDYSTRFLSVASQRQIVFGVDFRHTCPWL